MNYPLPEAFQRRVRARLGPEADAYFAALEQPCFRGLRLNPRKPLLHPEAAADGLGDPIPWYSAGGRYLAADSKAGLHPLHEAGAYYIQEPSAMAPVAVLRPAPGERILDLCAAPGGKSTQIADGMQGEGLLVCNEPVPGRAKILSRNLERMGVRNALAVSEEPERLASRWPGLFDAALVDAPCSGEGMFRRHPETRAQWNEQAPAGCAARQRRILAAAWETLRPGGRLVYSTCTLNGEENEENAAWAVSALPGCRREAFALPAGGGKTLDAPEGTLCLYPHQIQGEGHFVALLRKEGNGGPSPALLPPRESLQPPDREQLAAYEAFGKACGARLPAVNARMGDALLCAPELPPLEGVRVLRAGIRLGSLKGKVFQPDHALALALNGDEGFPSFSLSPEEAKRYLAGETLPCPETLSGFVLLTLDGLALGFGKASGGQIKNHYPKGLRIRG